MLTITHDAAALLANQRAEMGAPASFGVRLSARDEAEADGTTELVIAFVPAPMAGDQITEQEGLKAFVASELTRQLDGATLDATPTNGTPPELFLRR